ncbi:hypothetical protein [Leeuwenhoekiella sp. H156]|uniref:hypothetical protein n=1 Tax=Leeuwenhoekiella sp. H156 TaxID=3450128 RepID=UPI003FA44A29
MLKYLLYSTMVLVFSESLTIYGTIDLKFYYLIILFNLFIILAFKKNIYVFKYFVLFAIFLLVSSILTFVFHNSFKGFLQVIGISISVIYFYNFFKLFKHYLGLVLETYIKCVYYVCIIGLLLFFYFFLIQGDYSYRLHSVLTEPAHFAGITLPAFFLLTKNFRVNKKKWFIVSLSLLLSFSSIGFLCAGVALLLTSEKRKAFRIVFVVLILILTGNVAYYSIPNFRLRIDDTLGAFAENDVSDVNLSTYALLSNFYVAKESFLQSPIWGGGLGSHPSNHERYIENLPGYENFSGPERLKKLNAEDANSLLLRIISELGLIGIFLVIFFIKQKYSSQAGLSEHISRAVLVYFIYKLIREGNYFPPEMYFFVFMYYFNHLNIKNNLIGLRKSHNDNLKYA